MTHLDADIRIVTRIITETFKGIKTTRWMNLVIIMTMAAILSIFGCLFRTSLVISGFVEHLGDSMEISIYLKPGYNIEKTKLELLKSGNISSIKVISKEKAWEQMKQEMSVPDIKNPLPDTLRLRIKDNKKLDAVIKQAKTMHSVESIQYAKDIIEKIIRVGNVTNIVTAIVLLVLGGLTFSIINNTIYLVIQSKSEEIEIMRMMGIGNWSIKAPYILQGAFYGFCGALFAMLPLRILESYLISFTEFFNMGDMPGFFNLVITTLMVMGISVGSVGSYISVKKYLKI